MKQCKILLADDDPEDRAIIQDAMEMIHAGNIIQYAENGQKALEILDSHFHNNSIPHLIVLDLNMPKMNGTQTLEKLKGDKRFERVPVVIYSTSINPLEKEKCMQLGAHSYITKPVSFKESMETAQKFLHFCQTQIQA